MSDVKTQICKKCLIEKPLAAFYEHVFMKNGYETTCKKCKNEYTKIRNKELYRTRKAKILESK